MKLTCELCGGTLQMNAGGQVAACTTCGITYSMERLREMLNTRKAEAVKPEIEPYVSKQENAIPQDVIDVTYRIEEPVHGQKAEEKITPAGDAPKQFVMQVLSGRNGCVNGYVQQGGIGKGDRVYLNHDYSNPYIVFAWDGPVGESAKAGMAGVLVLERCPKHILKKAQIVTGDPNPVENAYTFMGTVRQYFTELLLREFSEYEVYADAQLNAINRSVDFLLCRDGKPVLALFLSNSNDSTARYHVKKAERECARERIAGTHFFDDYRNDASYVTERIRDALGKVV